MFVQCGALECGEVEAHGRTGILVLAQQFMAREVVAGELDEFGWWEGTGAGENLGVDMTAELLDTYLVEAGIGWNW